MAECAGALTGVGLAATFAVDLAFDDTRRIDAFFGGFFLIVVVLPAAVAFLRAAGFVTRAFLRFALPLCLAFILVATSTS